MTRQRFFRAAAIAFGSLSVCLLLSGCAAPVWLIDAQRLVPVLVSSATSIIALIASFSGSASPDALNQVNAWAAKLQTGLSDLEKLIEDYNASPTADLLQKIQAAAADVQANLTQDLSGFGLPAALQQKISALATVILAQLQAWISVLPLAQIQHTSEGGTVSVGTVTAPSSIKNFKSQFNLTLGTSTGDQATDTAAGATKGL